jgi:PAS domain S-box-containing protein
MKDFKRSALFRYGGAVLWVVLATLARFLVDPVLADKYPFAFYFLAVAGAATLGGPRPAALSIALSLLAADLFFIHPRGSLWISDPGMLLGMVVFSVVGVAIILLTQSQRKAVRQAAAEVRNFRVTITSIGDAVIATDRAARVTLMNKVAEELTGWTEKEARGRPLPEVFNIINEKTRQRWESPVERVIAEGVVVGLANHTALISKQGRERSIADSAAPIRDEEGRVRGVILVFRDVTEERRAREALRESEARFRTMADSAPVLIWMSGTDKLFEWFNQPWLDFTGRTLEQEIGNGWEESVHRDDLPGRLTTYGESFDARREFRMEYRLRRADGEYRWLLDHGIPRLAEDGSFLGYIGSCMDITERKESEEARARLAAIVESSTDAIVGKTLDGTIHAWNEAAERMFGYSTAEAIGSPITLVVPPERHGEEEHILERLRKGERVEHFETVRMARGGARIEVSLTISPIKDSSGQVIGASKIARDITERKRIQARVLEEMERFRITLGSIGDAVIATDVEGRLTVMNPVAEAITGFEEEEARGRPLKEVFQIQSELTRLPAEDPVERVLREGNVVGLANHTTLIARSGREVPIDDSAAPIRDREGRLLGVVLVFRDVTERRRTETEIRSLNRELHRRIAELQIIFDTAPVGIWIAHDPRCARVTENRYARDLLLDGQGLAGAGAAPASEGRGGRPGEKPPEPLLGLLRKAVEESAPLPLAECDLTGAAGKSISMTGSAVPLFDEDGKVRGAIASFIDITERKRAEEALRQEDRRKDEFLAMLAHELRNPLAPIRNAVHVLRLLGAPERNLEWAREVIDRQVQNLARLVDDLLDVSRISRGKITLVKERVGLAVVVANAVESSRSLIDSRRHRLELALPDQTVFLDADPVRLSQVLSNLLQNAAKYTPEGGLLSLSAEERGQEVSISVRDNGVGISPEILPRIFDLFVQGDQSLARSHGGLGIGLTLARKLVEMHGGRVEAKSGGPGKGSEFVVTLPVVAAAVEEQGSPREESTPPATRRRILVVDDNRDAAQSLAMLLLAVGHEVRTATDGPAALEEARQFSPEIVVLDIGLPGMDGYQVARRLRELFPREKVKIVALTGYGRDEDRRQAKEAGIDLHLVKPIEPLALEKILAKG